MTTYATSLRVGTAPRTNTATIERTQGKLQPTQARRFSGGKDTIKPFNRPSQQNTPKNNIQPFARQPKPASTPPNSGDIAKKIGQGASVARAIGGKTAAKLAPGIGINAKGDLDIGLKVLGTGVSISGKGDISIGVAGIVSATIDPKNSQNTTVDYGLGAATIESVQNGCTIITTVSFFGKVDSQTTRQADECVEPEPTPTPTPTPEPDPNPDNPLPQPQPRTFTPPPSYQGPLGRVAAFVGKGIRYGNMPYFFCQTSIIDCGMAPANTVNRTFNEVNFITSTIDGWQRVTPSGNSSWTGQLFLFNGSPGWVAAAIDALDWGVSGSSIISPGDAYNEINYCSFIIYSQRTINKPNETKPNKIANLPRGIMNNEDCDCSLLEDIYDMLGGDDFKEKGLEVPNHLYIPGGQGDTQALTYNTLINLLFRTLDHRTCGEVEISIKDNNIMKEGDQPLTMKLINNTAAVGKILELSQKQDSDLVAVLNLLMRLSWLSSQIYNLVNSINGGIKSLIKFLDMPFKEKVKEVGLPFDLSLGKKLGFDPKKPSEDQLVKLLDLDDPQKTIKILDKFMNNATIACKIQTFIGTKEGGNFWWMMDKKDK